MRDLRTLGMLGGLSWHSTVSYYQFINQAVEAELGEYRSAPLLMSSVDFGPIVQWQLAKEWDRAGEFLAKQALALEKSGAEAIIICSNTMHKVASMVEDALSIPLLHMASGLASELRRSKQSKVTLLGTRYTMNDQFLYEALRTEGIEAYPPSREHKKAINKAIFKRLVRGEVLDQDQVLLNRIVDDSREAGFDCVVLACTELALLMTKDTPKNLVLDSTRAHSKMAADFVLGR